MEWGIIMAAVSVFGSLALTLQHLTSESGPTDHVIKRPVHKLRKAA